MNAKVIIKCSILFALLVLVLNAPVTFGCATQEDGTQVECGEPSIIPAATPLDDGLDDLMAYRLLARATATPPIVNPGFIPVVVKRLPPAPLPAAGVKPTPRGDSPGSARDPTGAWEYSAPHSRVWYKINNGFRMLTIWLDANHQTGIDLSIYAPDQQDLHGKPVAHATYARGVPHDLFWTGRAPGKGNWYAVVSNFNDFSVPYRIDFARLVGKSSDWCNTCHGGNIEWDRCHAKNPTFCTDLRNEFFNQ